MEQSDAELVEQALRRVAIGNWTNPSTACIAIADQIAKLRRAREARRLDAGTTPCNPESLE